MSPEGFTTSITFRPAFDCLLVQPCVHGSSTCKPGSGGSHGRGSVQMFFVLTGPKGAVSLEILTGWGIDATPPNLWGRAGSACVALHSRTPRWEDHEKRMDCMHLPEGCYYDVGFSMADEPWRLLREQGEDAMWEWLVECHHEMSPA